MSQSDFVGTWTMNPTNSSHILSKMVIKDNGSDLLISLKKEPFKTYHGKYDVVQRKLRTNINGTLYFFVYVPANGNIQGYLESNQLKFADYSKN